MARGRQPWKYKTQQEREEARRERVRLNVRALRQRRKEEEEARRAADEAAVTGGHSLAPPAKEKKEFKFVVATAGVKRKRTVHVPADHVDVVECVDDVEEVEELLTNPTRWNDTVALFQRAGKLRSPGVFDVEKHSEYAAIDLQFDALSVSW